MGTEGEPPRPAPGHRRACHWPGRPGGREDDISRRLDYKGASGAADSERTQPALRSSGTRVRIAAGPACSAPSYPPARAAASVRPHTAPAPCTSPSCWPASCCSCYSRSGPPRPSPGRRRRWVLLRRCRDCEGVHGRAGGRGGCGPQEGAERAGRRPSLLSCARVRAGEPSEPGFGGLRPQPRENVDRCAALGPLWPAGQEAEAGRARDTRVAGGCGAEVPCICGGTLVAPKRQTALASASGWSIRGAAKFPALPPCVPSPACSFPPTDPANSAGGGAGRVPG